MKLLLHCLLVWIGFTISNVECEKVSYKSPSTNNGWSSVINHDGSLNITFDCERFGLRNVEFYIWNRAFPTDMASLTIQNCGTIDLNMTKTDSKSENFRKFSHFNLVNISRLLIIDQFSCLPTNVMMYNVYSETLHFPVLPEECAKLDLFWKTLVLKNVDIYHLRGTLTMNLRLLEMESIKVRKAKDMHHLLRLENQKAVVKIIDFYVHDTKPNLMIFNVSEVTLSDSKIKNFNENHMTFSFVADKVILIGNEIKALTNRTMKIISDNVQIRDSIFQRIDDDAFDNIQPKSMGYSSFDFSNNTIYLLTPKSLTNTLFSNLTITKNRVECTCKNFLWFESLNDTTVPTNYSFKWAKKDSHNKCLNINNCYIHQILMNYHDLCDKSGYHCPVSSGSLENRQLTHILIPVSCGVVLVLSFFACAKWCRKRYHRQVKMKHCSAENLIIETEFDHYKL